MLKLLIISSLFLAACKSAPINPETMCIIHEKRLVNGEFVEVPSLNRRCSDD